VSHPAALQWATTFIERESFSGQIAFDFIQAPTGELFGIECNPRATSGIHLLASHPRFVQAFLQEETTSLITPNISTTAMLASAMLFYALPAALTTHTFSQWLAAFTSAHDVLFTWDDPLPALWQFFSLIYLTSKALQHHLTPLEASTLDIEWNDIS
jgi:hypothetical protein